MYSFIYENILRKNKRFQIIKLIIKYLFQLKFNITNYYSYLSNLKSKQVLACKNLYICSFKDIKLINS